MMLKHHDVLNASHPQQWIYSNTRMTMMMFNNNKLVIVLLWAWCAVAAVEAFTQHTHTTPSSVVVLQASNSRRNFFNEISTKAVTTASLIMIPTMTAMSTIAGAEETAAAADDLAMPSEEEAIKADADALAERLRRKAELQKKGARPASFKESLSQELGKQKGMEKTKMERRNAMCEELGRGC